MKTNNILAIIALFAIALTGCENNSDVPESSITIFPNIEVQGSSNINLPCSETTYVDEGVRIFEGETEVFPDLITTFEGIYFGLTEAEPGESYLVTYTVFNEDGIPGSSFRNVFWEECNGDLVNSIAGTYVSSPLRTSPFDDRFVNVGSRVIIKDLGNNQYGISDAIGGYYEFGRALGPDFPVTGIVVTANDISANEFDYGTFVKYGEPFGIPEAEMTIVSLDVDPASGTIIMDTVWDFLDGGDPFTWTCTLVQQ